MANSPSRQRLCTPFHDTAKRRLCCSGLARSLASQPIDFLGLLLYARGCHISALPKRQILLRVSAFALHSTTRPNEGSAALAWREASTENIASQPIDFLGLLLYARGCQISALPKRQILRRVSASALHFTTQRNEGSAAPAWREASTENIASQPIDFLGLLLYARGCHISALPEKANSRAPHRLCTPFHDTAGFVSRGPGTL